MARIELQHQSNARRRSTTPPSACRRQSASRWCPASRPYCDGAAAV